MDETIFDPVLDELFSSLESLETQTRALATCLQEKGIVPAEDLEPYLKQAGEAANVRWRAERIRMNSLLSSVLKSAAESVTAQAGKAVRENRETPPRSGEDAHTEDGKQQEPDKHPPRAAAETGSENANTEVAPAEQEEKKPGATATHSNPQETTAAHLEPDTTKPQPDKPSAAGDPAKQSQVNASKTEAA